MWPVVARGAFGVVEELYPPGGQFLYGGLDVVHLEVGEGVLGCDGRAFEDGDLAEGPAVVPGRDWVSHRNVRPTVSP
jgi:hypothetical protein